MGEKSKDQEVFEEMLRILEDQGKCSHRYHDMGYRLFPDMAHEEYLAMIAYGQIFPVIT